MLALTQAQWADRFAKALSRLGSIASLELLVELGRDLYETEAGLSPEEVALAQFNECPPHEE